MARPWDPFTQAFGIRPPLELEGALLPGRRQQVQLPEQLRAPEPPRQTIEQMRQRIAAPAQAAPQQQTVAGMPGNDLARMLGIASSSVANLPKNATTGQALLALGTGLTAGKMGLEQQQRQERFDDARLAQAEKAAATEDRQQAAIEEFLAPLPPEMQRVYRAFPELAVKALTPTEQKLQKQTISRGDQQVDVLMDMATGRVVEELGSGPRFSDRPLATTTVNMPAGEKKYDEKRGEQWAEQAGEIAAAGRTAEEQLASLGPMMASLANPDVYQGTGGNAIAGLKRFGRTMLGLDFEGVGDAEVVQTIGNQMALSLRSMMPGPMSNADRTFLQSLPPNLGNSREGNILVGEFFRRSAERAVERAQAAREYEAENGRLDAGFDREWAAYMQANPVFSEEDYAVVQRLAAASPQPSPLAGVPDDIRDLLGQYGGN